VILFVDDEEVLRTSTREYLTLKGHTVVVAEDKAEAISMFDEHSEKIKLLIVDHQLPDGTGWQIVAHAQKTRVDIPVIYASGYYVVPEPEGVRVVDDHIIYVPKPFEMADLLSTIERIMPGE
jgi:two-component system, cell cycle sensor histidine kinase and response regulator CckA